MTIRRTLCAVTAAATLGILAFCALPRANGEPSGPYGGYSFNSADEISAGAVVKRELAVGEMLFWRIDLQPGQSIDVQASVTVPAGYDTGRSFERFGVAIYDPVRQPVWCKGDDYLTGIQTRDATARIGGRFRADCSLGNLADRDNAVQMAGSYYVQVGVGRSTVNRGTPLPLRLTIEVGEGVAAEPERPAAVTNPPSETAPSATDTGHRSPTPALPSQEPTGNGVTEPILLASAAMAAAAALAWMLPMRRRQRRNASSRSHRRGQLPSPDGSQPTDEATVRMRAASATGAHGTTPSRPQTGEATMPVRTPCAKPPPGTDPRETWHRE